ncbi:ester cyclase [Pseudonocardia dioxanivorans]|jgi:hypothetical protein|nr:ester cyclase [Pseudonocardia dioxanivorans]
MSAFAHKALLCSLYDQVVNSGRLDRLPEFVAPDFVGHLSGHDEPVRGPDALRDVIVGLRAAFPDLNTAIEGGWLLHELDTHAVGKGRTVDRLAARVVLRGTHTRPWHGAEPTMQEATWSEAVFAHVADGRLAGLVTVAECVSRPAYAGAAG